MNSIKPVVSNSAAGYSHPDDPALRVPATTPVSISGLPSSGNDGSKSYQYDPATGDLVKVIWTVNGAVYHKNFTWSNGSLSNTSEWVKQ